jgi:hypothetical protein
MPQNFARTFLGKLFFKTFSAENSIFGQHFLWKKFSRKFLPYYPRKKWCEKSAPDIEPIPCFNISGLTNNAFRKGGWGSDDMKENPGGS